MLYDFHTEQDKDTPLVPGLSPHVSCRAGEDYCNISQFTDGQGETVDNVEPGSEVRFQAAILPRVYVTAGMPFSIKAEGTVIAEGSISAVVRRGRY